MNEKRESTRNDFVRKVVYSLEGRPEEMFTARSLDISLGGIGLKAKKVIEKGKVLDLSLYLPGLKEPLKAKARLVWQDALPENGWRKAGLQFIEIPWTRLRTLVA